MQQLALVLLFTVFIYTGTIVEFAIPGTTILQTGQTIAVLCAGALLGPILGAVSVALYVAIGALGLPVFSEGGSGVTVLMGPSGGYLVGFVIAASFMGAACKRGGYQQFLACFACMFAGHAIILLCGWAWMSTLMGAAEAYSNGVAPFYLGSFVKSCLGAAIVVLLQKYTPAHLHLSKSEI